MLAATVAKIQERSPLKYNFARELASLDPRVMVSNPDQAIKMFQEVLQSLIETRWKTSEEADTVLAEYKKLASDAMRYHLHKFSSFKITTDRLDSFLLEVLQNQKKSAIVDYNATNSNIVPWASNIRKRIFSEQGSFGTLPSGNQFGSNETCTQLNAGSKM